MSNDGLGTENNGSNNYDFQDLPFLQWAREVLNIFRLQMQRVFNFVMIDLGGYEIFNLVAQWCVRNPTVFCCISALVLVVMLPALILVGFAISTILMTFTGFLVLEGTLLTGILILLFSCLGGLTLLLLFFVSFVAAIYYGLARLYDIYENFGSVQQNKQTLLNFGSKKKRFHKDDNASTKTYNNLDNTTTN